MSTDTRLPLPARLHSLATLAGLLERLEHQPSSASAEQYRAVARQVSSLLDGAEVDEHLRAILAAAPATAELYENLRGRPVPFAARAGVERRTGRHRRHHCRAPAYTAPVNQTPQAGAPSLHGPAPNAD